MGKRRRPLRSCAGIRGIGAATAGSADADEQVAAEASTAEKGREMTNDKTGAATVVSCEDGKYTIAVEGKAVGLADFADRGDQRVFYPTEIDPQYGGRGLATILVEQALNEARGESKRIVPV